MNYKMITSRADINSTILTNLVGSVLTHDGVIFDLNLLIWNRAIKPRLRNTDDNGCRICS